MKKTCPCGREFEGVKQRRLCGYCRDNYQKEYYKKHRTSMNLYKKYWMREKRHEEKNKLRVERMKNKPKVKDKYTPFWEGVICERCFIGEDNCGHIDVDEDVTCGELMRNQYDRDMLSRYEDKVDEIISLVEEAQGSAEALCNRYEQEVTNDLPWRMQIIKNRLEELWNLDH
jgi:hypothetical protein